MPEGVPGLAAVICDVVAGLENEGRKPGVPDERPDVLDRVRLWCPWRPWDEGDVVGDNPFG